MESKKLQEIFDSGIYALTGEEFSQSRSNIEVVKALIAGGVKIIQYREKNKKPLYKFQECLEIRKLTKAAGVTFIVNDDLDIAQLVEADGVHIGQEDLPLEKVRDLVGAKMFIGLSTHSPEQAQDALRRGADYIGVGPMYPTSTKKDVGQTAGLEYLEYVAQNIPLPFVVIGGIKASHIPALRQRGARCIAMITEILEAPDIAVKVQELKKLLEQPCGL